VIEQYKSKVMSWRLVPDIRKRSVTSFHYHILVPVMNHDKAEITSSARRYLKLRKKVFYDKVQLVTGTDEAVFLWLACLLPEERATRGLFDDAQRSMEECLAIFEDVTVVRRKAAGS
jgi:hypothetical protein